MNQAILLKLGEKRFLLLPLSAFSLHKFGSWETPLLFSKVARVLLTPALFCVIGQSNSQENEGDMTRTENGSGTLYQSVTPKGDADGDTRRTW